MFRIDLIDYLVVFWVIVCGLMLLILIGLFLFVGMVGGLVIFFSFYVINLIIFLNFV